MFSSAYPRVGIEWSVAGSDGPQVLNLANLEELRDRLVNRLEDVRAELRERHRAELANRRLIDRMLDDPAAHKWIQVSAEDVGARGCRHWHSLPRHGIIGMLLGWWRVRISSGCPLAGGRGRQAVAPKLPRSQRANDRKSAQTPQAPRCRIPTTR